jgi:transposase
VPAPDVRTWRELINCRGQVIAKRTRAKNAPRALLRGAGVVPPRHPDLWAKAGLAWLRRLDLPTVSQQLRPDLLLEEVEALNRQLRRIEQQLGRRARQLPAVARLRSIPGVGIRTAEAVAAFVDDPDRSRFRESTRRWRHAADSPCSLPDGFFRALAPRFSRRLRSCAGLRGAPVRAPRPAVTSGRGI